MRSVWLAKATLTLFLIETGVRVSSAQKLRLRQVDFDSKTVRELWTKRTKFQDFALSPEMAAVLRFHVTVNEVSDRVFDRDVKTLWRWVRDMGELAGVRVHPHKLRHTFATILLEATGDLQLVQQAMGHANVSTTTRYTMRTDDKLRKELGKAWKHMRAPYRR